MGKTEGIDFPPKLRASQELRMSKLTGKSQAVPGTLSTPCCLGASSCRKPSWVALTLWGLAETWWGRGLREIVRDPREADQTELWEGRIVREDGRSTPKAKESTELDREDRACGFEPQLGIWITPVFPLMPFFLFQGPTQDSSLL